jgi:hypothetical protein
MCAWRPNRPKCIRHTYTQTHLSDTFEFKGNGNSWGQQDLHGAIKYRVKAECDVAGSKHDIKCRTPILVVQFPTRPPVEVVQRDAQPVTCCCCCDKGSAVITARCQKDIYTPGEIVYALLEVENLSGTQFEAVVLELRRTVKLRAGHESAVDTDVLQCATFPGACIWWLETSTHNPPCTCTQASTSPSHIHRRCARRGADWYWRSEPEPAVATFPAVYSAG